MFCGHMILMFCGHILAMFCGDMIVQAIIGGICFKANKTPINFV
jgi:hypothetical protein